MWSVCEVVFIPYVDAVTLMHVLLFVFILRECDGDDNACVEDGGGVVAVSVCVVHMLCIVQTTC